MFSKSNIKKAAIGGVIQIVLFTLLYIYCNNYVKRIFLAEQRTSESFLNPSEDDLGLTKVDWERVKSSKPELVKAGIYLHRIQDFDILRSRWSCQFYVWFLWNPKKVNFIDLRDSVVGVITNKKAPIKIVSGDIEKIQTNSFYINPKGDSAYILFDITGTTTKFFNVSLYPLDNYLLIVQIEPVGYNIHEMAFLPDTANANVSSRVAVNGFEKNGYFILSKPHTIKSTLGDPRKTLFNTYSQLRLALSIKRGDLTMYLRIFFLQYISVLIAFLYIFVKDNDKIRVLIGSLFFTAATLNIIISRIPATNMLSIAEIVNNISLLTVLFIFAGESFMKFFTGKNEQLGILNKWISLSIAFIFYIIINVTIPLESAHVLPTGRATSATTE